MRDGEGGSAKDGHATLGTCLLLFDSIFFPVVA